MTVEAAGVDGYRLVVAIRGAEQPVTFHAGIVRLFFHERSEDNSVLVCAENAKTDVCSCGYSCFSSAKFTCVRRNTDIKRCRAKLAVENAAFINVT